MKGVLFAYLATLAVLAVLDGVWLGYLARDFYAREIASIAADPVRWLPAAIFYFAYPMGLIILALRPLPTSIATAMGRAGLVGLVAYGTYDLTNMATLQAWSWRLALVDTAWGTVLSAAMGAAAFVVLRRML